LTFKQIILLLSLLSILEKQNIFVGKKINIMLKNKENNMLLDEVKLLCQYGVPASDFDAAIECVDKYQKSRIILRLLEEYYSTLPEGREEAVVKVAMLDSSKGVLLLVLSTGDHAYLYVVSDNDVVWLGEYGSDIRSEILQHFGYTSQKDFQKKCPKVEDLEEFDASSEEHGSFCPVCGVAEGEHHLLGCSVEICPWCDGQLNTCNCRFEQLKIEEIEGEEQLETFAEMLDAKGRISYKKEEGPAYPGTSAGLDEAGSTTHKE